MRKKAQSLPKLKKLEIQAKTQSLAKLFQNQTEIQPKTTQQNNLNLYQPLADPQKNHRQQINNILLKSKKIIDNNKDKLQVAKRFRILKKKNTGPFLTGVDIYKDQQDFPKYAKHDSQNEESQTKMKDQQSFKKLLSEKYDDLSELRKMIRKTSKNLGAYKQQTMNIKKNIIFMADKYDCSALNFIGRNRILQKVEDFENEI